MLQCESYHKWQKPINPRHKFSPTGVPVCERASVAVGVGVNVGVNVAVTVGVLVDLGAAEVTVGVLVEVGV